MIYNNNIYKLHLHNGVPRNFKYFMGQTSSREAALYATLTKNYLSM